MSFMPRWLAVPAALVFLALVQGTATAMVSISPAYLEISFDTGRPSGQFVISNTGEETERYRINATHFTFGETGNLDMIPPDGNSIAPWIKFNPKEISLPPKSNVKVRFSVVPNKKLDDREYWAAMELESLKTNNASGQDGSGRTMTLEVVSAIVVPIFARNGKVRNALTIKDIAVRTGEASSALEIRVMNVGTGHLNLSGSYRITDAAGTVVDEGALSGDYVLAGSPRLISVVLQKKLAPGEYQVQVACNAPQLAKPVIREVTNSW